MRFILFATLSLCFQPLFAQLTSEQRIEDSIIGWWNNNRFDKLKPQTEPLKKLKEQHVNKFVEWMKKSYTPVGGLGTVSRFIKNDSYGVMFLVWNVSHEKMWVDEKGHFNPIAEENTRFYVATNSLPGSFSIEFINKNGGRMFTMQPKGYGSENRKGSDPRIHSNAYPYITWVNEWTNIFLAPGNKLPIVAVTRGQLLDAAESALQVVLADEKKRVESQWPNNVKAQQEALVERAKNIERYRVNIHKLREKYANSLDEPAVVRDMQMTMYSFDTDPDPFVISDRERETKQFYPVYTIEPSVADKLTDEKPLWVAVSVPYRTKENGNREYEMYTAVTQNLNVEYIYNYFFAPDKVKGVGYAPANAAALAARLDGYRNKNKSSVEVAPSTNYSGNTIFADDFSANNAGAVPRNWFFRTASAHSTIATVQGQKGNWVKLGVNNPLRPNLVKYPLKNFVIDFDLVTDGGYSDRTGGAARFTLNSRKIENNGDETTTGPGEMLTINFVSGHEDNYESNYRGEIEIDLHSSPSKNRENNNEGAEANIALKEFTNNKRKIHVTVKVRSGSVAVLVNGKEMSNSSRYTLKYGGACITCGFEPATSINALSWTATTNDAERVQVYLGNVVMSKL